MEILFTVDSKNPAVGLNASTINLSGRMIASANPWDVIVDRQRRSKVEYSTAEGEKSGLSRQASRTSFQIKWKSPFGKPRRGTLATPQCDQRTLVVFFRENACGAKMHHALDIAVACPEPLIQWP